MYEPIASCVYTMFQDGNYSVSLTSVVASLKGLTNRIRGQKDLVKSYLLMCAGAVFSREEASLRKQGTTPLKRNELLVIWFA